MSVIKSFRIGPNNIYTKLHSKSCDCLYKLLLSDWVTRNNHPIKEEHMAAGIRILGPLNAGFFDII